jgi:hypothetical protein
MTADAIQHDRRQGAAVPDATDLLMRAHAWLSFATAPDGQGDAFLNEGQGWDAAAQLRDDIGCALLEGALRASNGVGADRASIASESTAHA